ncbi:MAG: HEAT repeat domain-containing protein [Aggregatilineales bacterium]
MTKALSTSLTTCLEQLQHDNPANRMNAVQQLVSQGADVIPILKPLLHDADERLQRGAEGVLWRLALQHMTEKMSHALPSASEKTRHRILAFLENINMQAAPQPVAPHILPALITMLTADHSSIRVRAAILLAGIGRAAAIPHLLPLIQDNNAFVRSVVISELTFLSAHEAMPQIIIALDDPDPQVRREAAFAPGWLQATDAIPALIDHLDDEDADVRRRIIQSLSVFEDNRAISALEYNLINGAIDARIAVFIAMKRCENTRFIPALLDLLTIASWTQQLQILQKLRSLDSSITDPLLTEWYPDPPDV